MIESCIMDFKANFDGKTEITIYEITGKTILILNEILTKGIHKYSINGLGCGIYTVEIKSEKYYYTKKIISSDIAVHKPNIKHIETALDFDKKNKTLNTIKNIRSVSNMQYNTGDILKLTGKSGNYRTVSMLIPTNDQTVTFNFVNCTDADGNHYAVVQIGTQIWMAENLKTTSYRNNDPIPYIAVDTSWFNLSTGAYCYYNHDINNYFIYGNLYNWFTVYDIRNIAPVGWHVPSDSEWTTLTTYLGGISLAGAKLKKNCSTLWHSPNIGATNETGFTGLPGSYRDISGPFDYIGHAGFWWSSTEHDIVTAGFWQISYGYLNVNTGDGTKTGGLSVRCVMD